MNSIGRNTGNRDIIVRPYTARRSTNTVNEVAKKSLKNTLRKTLKSPRLRRRSVSAPEKLKTPSSKTKSFSVKFRELLFKKHPIEGVGNEPVIRNMCKFFSGNVSPKTFLINGKPLDLPTYYGNESEIEKKIKFFVALIKGLNLPSKTDIQKQAELICHGLLELEEKEKLTEALWSYLEKNKSVGGFNASEFYQHCKSSFSDSLKLIESFCTWAEEPGKRNLAGVLRSKNNRKISQKLVKAIVERFLNQSTLSALFTYVPSYPILQSLSFEAYNPCYSYISKNYLSLRRNPQKREPDKPVMNYNSHGARFEVTITGKTYEAKQVRTYRFYYWDQEKEAEKIFGGVEAHWTIFGSLEGDLNERRAKLELENLHFEPDAKEVHRKTVIEELKLNE